MISKIQIGLFVFLFDVERWSMFRCCGHHVTLGVRTTKKNVGINLNP